MTASNDTASAGGAGATLSSPLHDPTFRWFFVGRFVSLLGTSMAPIALAFAVLNATNSAAEMGVVLTANTVPLLVFTLAGGVVGDRFSRRAVLLVSHLGAGLTQSAVAVLLIYGNFHLVPVVILEAANGTLAAFTAPALRGIVPDIVTSGSTQRANSLLGSARNLTRILGPTAGASIVVAVGGGWAIAFDALTYFVAVVCLMAVRLSSTVPPRSKSPLAELREGWTEFTSRTWVWAIVASFGITNYIQVGIWSVLGPLISRDTIGEPAWGVVLSVKAVGVLAMSVAMYRIVLRRLLPVGQLCIALTALPLVALGTGVGFWWLAVATLVAGLGTGVYAIAWETSLFEHVPRTALSRVSSYDNLGSFVAIPAGQLTAAPLAAAFGATRVALVGGILYGVVALAPLLTRSLRGLRHEPS